jgi:hypothetical protein
MQKREPGILRLLVTYYGLIQILHFSMLALESFNWGRTGTPAILAPPPPAGWTDQALWLLAGTGVADAISIPFSVLFAWGWLRGKAWSDWLGALTLGGSMFSAIVFAVGTVPAGVWQVRLAYWIEALLFLPIGVLFILFLRRLLQAQPESESPG